MNIDDLFGVILLFVSVLAALFFMISVIKNEAILAKQKAQTKNRTKSKFEHTKNL